MPRFTFTDARAAMFLFLAAGACATPATNPPDASPSADHPLSSGGAGGGSGGSGGSTPAGGGGQGTQGGGAGGAGNGGGGGGQGGGGRDAGAGGTNRRDAARAADLGGSGGSSVGDGGAVACDDITSPGRLAVYYYSNSEPTGSSIQMYFDVVNFTAFSARLSQVTVRYWFTDEDPASPNQLEQYYVPIPTSMKFTRLNPAREGADTVLEIGFTGAGDAGGSFVETRGFNFAFHKASYAGTFEQANDYSYDGKLKTALGQNPRITAYVSGELAWGCEPPPLPPPPLDGGAAVDSGL